MCAWYITRVHTKVTKTIYVLCLFSMIVPFQMVMFTLSKFANLLHLSNPLGIIVVYLGFGAGLAVFMFTGFVTVSYTHLDVYKRQPQRGIHRKRLDQVGQHQKSDTIRAHGAGAFFFNTGTGEVTGKLTERKVFC